MLKSISPLNLLTSTSSNISKNFALLAAATCLAQPLLSSDAHANSFQMTLMPASFSVQVQARPVVQEVIQQRYVINRTHTVDPYYNYATNYPVRQEIITYNTKRGYAYGNGHHRHRHHARGHDDRNYYDYGNSHREYPQSSYRYRYPVQQINYGYEPNNVIDQYDYWR